MDKNDQKLEQEGGSGVVANKILSPLVDRLQKNRATPESEEEEPRPGSEQDSETKQDFPKFTEKKIRNMIRAPFELAYVLTGVQEVRLKEEEVNLVLEDALDSMNYFVKVNPIYLSVFGLFVNLGAITTQKIKAVREAKANPKKEDEKK